VEEAQGEAARILDGASREAEAARRAGEEAGREEGRARAALLVLRAGAERDRLLAGCSSELAVLAAAMATRILGREIRPGVDAVAAAARALAEVRGEPRVTLRVSPPDAAAIRGDHALGGIVGALRVREDASLSAGEVVVEADGATVDGRFAAQRAVLMRLASEPAA
jgi:flagellar biosynthesis/type III secretory pathway protein FliH